MLRQDQRGDFGLVLAQSAAAQGIAVPRAARAPARARRSIAASRAAMRAIALAGATALPVALAVWFVSAYATAFPLTDEWHFVSAVLGLQGVGLFTARGWEHVWTAAHFGAHRVLVPFLYYLPVSEWTHFDSRWLIYTTVFLFAVDAFLYARFVVRSWVGALPIVLVLFAPSHYMEFLWGWQFTLAFSIVFPLAGLVLVDRMHDARNRWGAAGLAAAALALFAMGTLSSAGGFFGLPCATLLVALKPWKRAERIAWTALFAVATAVMYALVMSDPECNVVLAGRQVLQGLTALGAAIVGSPVGLSDFGVDARSLIGIVIVACALAVLARAVMIRALPGIALALSIAAFGALCIASITLSREYLGNWHVQYALPALCGAYAASFVLWRIDRSRFAAVPFFTLLALLAASVIGYAKGFGEYGPSYHQYITSIEQYMRAHLTHPRAAKPFPDGPAMTPAMLLFLSAHRHPVFHDDPEPASLAPLPESARVLVDGSEIVPPFVVGGVLGGDRAKPVIVLVGLTRDDPAHGVCARTGGEMLVLRRIHPALGGQGCVDDRARAWYAGLIVPELLPRGAHCVELWVR